MTLSRVSSQVGYANTRVKRRIVHVNSVKRIVMSREMCQRTFQQWTYNGRWWGLHYFSYGLLKIRSEITCVDLVSIGANAFKFKPPQDKVRVFVEGGEEGGEVAVGSFIFVP